MVVSAARGEVFAPQRTTFAGSIKWREQAPFHRQGLNALVANRPKVPGADEKTLLVGVSRSGFATQGLDVILGSDDLLGTWERSSAAPR